MIENRDDPKKSFELCIYRADIFLNEIKKLGEKLISISCISLILFIFTFIFMNAVLSNGVNGFGFAAFLTGILIGTSAIFISVTRTDKREKKYSILLKLREEAKSIHSEYTEQREKSFSIQSNEILQRFKAIKESAKSEFEKKLSELHQEISLYKLAVDLSSPAWEHESWQGWDVASKIPDIIRLGELTTGRWNDDRTNIKDCQFSMPALLPFPSGENILFWAKDQGRNLIAKQLPSLLLRLIASIPPGKLRFTFIDPVGLGQNAAAFLHLADYDESLVTAKAWSEPRHIEQRLGELTEHIENVIQKYLRNTYETIEEFNASAGELAEPYRFLIIYDFPVNFSEDATRRLISILQSGPRCGLYTIIVHDGAKDIPYGFEFGDISRHTRIYYWDGHQLVWAVQDSFKCLLTLDEPPAEEYFTSIISKVGKAAVQAMRVEVPFTKILEKAELTAATFWSGSTEDEIAVPLGPLGASKVQFLQLGKGTSQHVLIAGKTGSGKSTLLHVFITALSLKYSPDEVQLYLIDFKKGVEFKTYAVHSLPHARVIAIESEREFGLSVLHGLDAELKRRGDLFRTTEVDGLKSCRRKTGQIIPRIILLVDEFQEFFTEDDAVAAKAAQVLDRLVRQGRAFGIHVILGSQTLAGAYTLARSTIDQMAVRIALQCSEADSRLILSEDNAAARLLSRPGEAICNAANGMVEGNNPFQVAWLPDEERDQHLDGICGLAKRRGLFPPQGQIVFEGNAPADAEHCHALRQFLRNPPPQAGRKRFSAWLGEPIAIKEAAMASFRRQSGSNLLVVGQDAEAAKAMLAVSVLTLAAQHRQNPAMFYLLDFSSADDLHSNVFNLLADMLTTHAHYGKRRQLPEFIGSIADEVRQRMEHEEDAPAKPTVYLIIYGLHRARDLEPADNYDGEQNAVELGKKFTEILKEGPDLGIHSLVWCDTCANLNRRLSRQAVREFELRAAFQMSREDSSLLIDSPNASSLGQYRALLHSEEEGMLEKFRPFALPREQWLREMGTCLNTPSHTDTVFTH